MKTSEKLYAIYRQARGIEKSLCELRKESGTVDDAMEAAGRLADEIFECVGRAAAYEMDNEYREQNMKK